MRYRALIPALATGVIVLMAAASASAQVFHFERTLPVDGIPTVNISTIRGRVSVRAGEAGRVVVNGTVRVRIGPMVPADASALAKAVADRPPIEQAGDVVHVRAPSDPATESAVTVGYEVSVPPATILSVRTDSGALEIDGIQGSVTVRTESGAVTLAGLADTEVISGSGGVTIRGIGGRLKVTTGSGGITAAGLQDGLEARSNSGHIDIVFDGPGDVDVRTQSSAITLGDVKGALTVHSNSGRVRASGAPVRGWTVTTGSSAIDITLDDDAPATLVATTESGSVKTTADLVSGEMEKGRVSGTIRGGGPTVRLESRSGSITVR